MTRIYKIILAPLFVLTLLSTTVSAEEISSITKNIGLYGGFDMSYNTVDETQISHEIMYAYRIITGGLTYSPTKNLTFMGGVE